MKNEFKEAITEFASIKKELTEKLTSRLNDEFKRCFEEYPELTLIKWSQFTPYFNDGDTCEFNINSFTVSNAKNSELVNTWGEYDISKGPEPEDLILIEYLRNSKYELIKEIEDFAQSELGEGIFKSVFGDHVIVTVTKDNITSEEYEHE